MFPVSHVAPDPFETALICVDAFELGSEQDAFAATVHDSFTRHGAVEARGRACDGVA